MDVDVEVLIVGAGISGIGAAIELLRRGRTSLALLERADDLGGTWRDNTYPGVAVDIPSSSYCFPFETDYPWARAYAEGAQIQDYVRHVAEKHGVTQHIRYGKSVTRASFRDGRWHTELADGTALVSRFLISATGLFTTPTLPDIPGRDSFRGPAFHSARWDHGAALEGKRVAVIGTGASAAQIIPAIAAEVGQLSVFQRTPIWISPRPDYPLPRPERWYALRRFGAVRALGRLASELNIEVLTLATAVYQRFPPLVGVVQAVVRAWMAAQVRDPAVREALLPDYTLGCKRPTPSNTYLKTFNLPHVSLVTAPIQRIAPEGVVTEDGVLHEADVLVMATGFLTTQKGNAPAFEVVGRSGVELGQHWEAHRLQCYRGVAVPGFPNFFLTAGPYSGGFNWFTMLTAHLDQIIGCIEQAHREGATLVEVEQAAHDAWMREMWRHAEGTVFKSGGCASARSYYIDRHGDAALPLPRTPWWRAWRLRGAETEGFRFSGG